MVKPLRHRVFSSGGIVKQGKEGLVLQCGETGQSPRFTIDELQHLTLVVRRIGIEGSEELVKVWGLCWRGETKVVVEAYLRIFSQSWDRRDAQRSLFPAQRKRSMFVEEMMIEAPVLKRRRRRDQGGKRQKREKRSNQKKA